MERSKTLRALLVGGPMYDGLYERFPRFERESGFKVQIVARLPHPELNARVRSALSRRRRPRGRRRRCRGRGARVV